MGSGKREREEQEDDEVTFLGEGSQVATQSSQVDKDKETPPPEDDEVRWANVRLWLRMTNASIT